MSTSDLSEGNMDDTGGTDVTAQWWLLPSVSVSASGLFPAARDSASLCLFEGRIFLFGGYSDTQSGERFFDDLWEGTALLESEVENNMSARSPAHPMTHNFPQRSPLVVPSQARNSVPSMNNATWSEAGGVRWSLVSPTSSLRPPALWGHTALVPRQSSSMIVVGGHDMTSRVWSFHLPTLEWHQVTLHRTVSAEAFDFGRYSSTTVGDETTDFPTRYLHSAVPMRWNQLQQNRNQSDVNANDEAIILFGGLSSSEECCHDVVVIGPISASSDAVVALNFSIPQVTGEAPVPRFGHGAASYDGSMFVFGGTVPEEDPIDFSAVYRLEASTWVWSKLDVTGSVPRARFMFSSFFDPLGLWFICGGQHEGSESPIEMVVFDLVAHSWASLASFSGPYPQAVISAGHITLPDAESDLVALFAMGNCESYATQYSDELLLFRMSERDRRKFLEGRHDRPGSRGGEDPSPLTSGGGDEDDRARLRHTEWSPGSTLTSTVSSMARARATSARSSRPMTTVAAAAPAQRTTVIVSDHAAAPTSSDHHQQDRLINAVSTLMDQVHALHEQMNRRFNEVNRRIDLTNRNVETLRDILENSSTSHGDGTDARLALERVLAEIRLRR